LIPKGAAFCGSLQYFFEKILVHFGKIGYSSLKKSTGRYDVMETIQRFFAHAQGKIQEVLDSQLPNIQQAAEYVTESCKKGGKFYQMFAAGDGHELEDYTDEQGRFHLAHAKSLYSSSMLAYNFFH
jgi:hypothetical protein